METNSQDKHRVNLNEAVLILKVKIYEKFVEIRLFEIRYSFKTF